MPNEKMLIKQIEDLKRIKSMLISRLKNRLDVIDAQKELIKLKDESIQYLESTLETTQNHFANCKDLDRQMPVVKYGQGDYIRTIYAEELLR